MLDRLFMPALTFTLLVAATAAFANEFSAGHAQTATGAKPIVVTLERVVVTASATDHALSAPSRPGSLRPRRIPLLHRASHQDARAPGADRRGDKWGGEKQAGSARAARASCHLTRRDCLNGVSAANRSEFHDATRGEYRSADRPRLSPLRRRLARRAIASTGATQTRGRSAVASSSPLVAATLRPVLSAGTGAGSCG